jgi:methyl-accepting chemotaxis protein
MKLSVKSALVFLASGLIPLATISLVGYDQLREQAVDRAHDQVRQEALRVVDSVNAWMSDNRRMMTVLARNQQVIEAAQARKALDSVEVLQAFGSTYSWHTVVFLSDTTGQQVSRSDRSGLVKMGHQAAAQRVLRDGAAAADSAVIGTADSVPSILFVNAVRPYGNLELLGLVGARATVGEITRIVAPSQAATPMPGLLVMLATPAGEVLVHTAFSADKKQSNLIGSAPEFVAASAKQGVVSFDGAQGSMLGYSARTDSGWILLYAVPQAQVLEPVQRAARWFGLICLAALGLFGGVAWLASRAVARPILHLSRVADRVSKGHLDDIELAGLEARGDEIGELARAVSRLVISFKAALGMLKKRPSS